MTFEGAKLSIGRPSEDLPDHFDACCCERDEIGYISAAIATLSEADELLLHAKASLGLFKAWIDSIPLGEICAGEHKRDL